VDGLKGRSGVFSLIGLDRVKGGNAAQMVLAGRREQCQEIASFLRQKMEDIDKLADKQAKHDGQYYEQ
jgi:hypothetical protein